jgi:sugar transferase EpsL
MRRHDAKPGITGWAQIHGRNDISWEDRFALDVWYADHQSFWLDLRIIAVTLWKVLRREGIGKVDAEPFQGQTPAMVSNLEDTAP